MKEIKFTLPDDKYERINTIVKWLDTRDELFKTEKYEEYLIEDFVKGATLSKLNEIEYSLNPTFSNINSEVKIKNNFKAIAKRKGVRQVDICQKLDVDKAYLSQVFNNKSQPGLELFLKIWAMLGCPPMHKAIQFED